MTGYYRVPSYRYNDFNSQWEIIEPNKERMEKMTPEERKGKALFLQAMHKFQQNMGVALKDSNNPFYKSNYSDYPSVVEAFKQAAVNTGLSYRHEVKVDPKIKTLHQVKNDGEFEVERITVETIVSFSDGENFHEVSSSMPVTLPKTMNNPSQEIGKAITYNKRYTLQPLLGIPSDDDDDGNSLSPNTRSTQTVNSDKKTRPKVESNNPPLTSEVKKEPDSVKPEPTDKSSLKKLTFNKFEMIYAPKAVQYVKDGLSVDDVIKRLQDNLPNQGLSLQHESVIKQIKDFLIEKTEG